jgi:ketosteroid isomerase-like protein
MSQENVEIVRHIVDGWARGDFSETDGFHPDVEFELVDWPERARAQGMDAMRRTWYATLSAWDDYRSPAVDFIESGPHVVVTVHLHARGKTSGAVVDADTAAVFTMDAGKVVRLALYWDRTKALEAVGLSEQDAHANS